MDGQNPSVVMCRAYYTRTVLAAWDCRNGQLTSRWVFDTDNGFPSYAGQGNHNLSVADLDDDGRDEIIYGSMAVDDDGTGRWTTGLGHGDALQFSDIDPTRNGQEIWRIHENAQVGSALRGGATGQLIWQTGPGDVGRGVSANLMPDRQYRLAIAWQNVGYNQPPHPSFFVGASMFIPDNLKPPSVPLNVKTPVWDDTVQVAWSPNTDSDLAGYRLHRGTLPDSFSITIEMGTDTSYLDISVTNDSTYYYAVTAYDFDGNESDYSEVVQATPSNRPATPAGVDSRSSANAALILWDPLNTDLISETKVFRSSSPQLTNPLVWSLDNSETTFEDSRLTFGIGYYYAVSVVDTNQIESFMSEVQLVVRRPFFNYQAEDGDPIGTVFIENNHLGYNGSGFVNFDGSNSGMEFTYMPGFGGGDKTLVFRYTLGNDPRTGNLIVNGVSMPLTMRNTGAWTTYVTDRVAIVLNDGFVNTIRFETTGNDFGNLDEITVPATALTAIADPVSNLPAEYRLLQNYPNPFNPQTTIEFQLPAAAVYIIIDCGQKTLWKARRCC